MILRVSDQIRSEADIRSYADTRQVCKEAVQLGEQVFRPVLGTAPRCRRPAAGQLASPTPLLPGLFRNAAGIIIIFVRSGYRKLALFAGSEEHVSKGAC